MGLNDAQQNVGQLWLTANAARFPVKLQSGIRIQWKDAEQNCVRFVERTHDEADDGLCEEATNHSPFWSDVVNDKCTNDCSRHIKQT